MRLARSFHLMLEHVAEAIDAAKSGKSLRTSRSISRGARWAVMLAELDADEPEVETTPAMSAANGNACINIAADPAVREAYTLFWVDTRHVWRGIAANLYQRWKPPAGVTVDDVYQQLGENVWNLLISCTYDPSKGRTRADYIIYNACTKGKYFLHQQREANLHGNHDKNPSRYATSYTEAGINYDERGHIRAGTKVLMRTSVPASQHRAVERREELNALLETITSTRDRFALVALYFSDGSPYEAAKTIYEDLEMRLMCRLGSVEQALFMVRAAIHTHLDDPLEEEE